MAWRPWARPRHTLCTLPMQSPRRLSNLRPQVSGSLPACRWRGRLWGPRHCPLQLEAFGLPAAPAHPQTWGHGIRLQLSRPQDPSCRLWVVAPCTPRLSTSTSRTLAIFPLSAPVTTPQDPGAHPGHSPHPCPGPPRSHRQPPPAPPRPLSPQCLLRAAVQADRRGRRARRGRAGGQARGLALGRQPPVLHLPRQPAVPRLRGHPAELPVAADGRPLLPGEKVRVGTLPRAGLCARAAKASAGRSAARATRGPLPAGRCTSGG